MPGKLLRSRANSGLQVTRPGFVDRHLLFNRGRLPVDLDAYIIGTIATVSLHPPVVKPDLFVG